MSAPAKSEMLDDRHVAGLTKAMALRFEYRCALLKGESLAHISEQYEKLTSEWLWEPPKSIRVVDILVDLLPRR
jgi:hypothetical protein